MSNPYHPQGTTPGQPPPAPIPPKKSGHLTLKIILGVVGGLTLFSILGVVACTALLASVPTTTAEVSTQPSTEVSQAPSNEPTDELSEAPTDEPTDEPSEAPQAKVGDALIITGPDGEDAEITLVKVSDVSDDCIFSSKDLCNAKLPVRSFRLRIEGTGSKAFHVNPYEFWLETPNGDRLEYGDGDASSYGPENGSLNDAYVKPKRKLNGFINFEGPKTTKGLLLVYGPGLSESIGEWKIG